MFSNWIVSVNIVIRWSSHITRFCPWIAISLRITVAASWHPTVWCRVFFYTAFGNNWLLRTSKKRPA